MPPAGVPYKITSHCLKISSVAREVIMLICSMDALYNSNYSHINLVHILNLEISDEVLVDFASFLATVSECGNRWAE